LKNHSLSRMIQPVAIRLMHVVDEGAAEDGLRLLSLLLQRLPTAEIAQEVAIVGPPSPALVTPPGTSVHRLGRRPLQGLLSAVDLQRVAAVRHPDLLHAWSGSASALIGLACSDAGRTSVTLSDPAMAQTAGRWWRSRETPLKGAAVCSAKLVQRKLIEAGIPPVTTVVIRPGVDFAAIRAAKEGIKREDLGLPPTGHVILTTSPPSRAGGHFLALWAMAILNQAWSDARLIVPGRSREQRRLLRLRDEINCPDIFLFVQDRYSPAELLGVSDALVAPATGDISTGWLAWAMAASVPVMGSAIPAIAELIADRQNGFLCRPGEVHSLAIRIRTAFDSPDLLRSCAERARGQAYDVFRAQTCVEQYLRLFKNLHAGVSPGQGIRDTAFDA
jgi:glycosyltransferase involved in cell wall biosynthesis